MLQLSPNPQGIRLLLNPELADLVQMNPGLPLPTNCITCRGEKTFRYRAPDDYEGIAEYECNCNEQWALHVYLLHCGIEKTYQRLSWRDVDAEPGAVMRARDYADLADIYVDAGFNMIFHGQMGAGKTLLAVLVLKHLLGLGIEGYFVPFQRMVRHATEGWRDPERAQWFRRRIENVSVLVLDDVGKEHTSKEVGEDGKRREVSTSVTEKTFDAVLRHRVAASKPTILTTNLDLDQLKASYGTNVFSLLEERASTYRFVGENFRTRQRERVNFEMDNRLTRPIVLA